MDSGPASGSTTNSVRFNSGGHTVTLSGVNTIQSSGILMTPSAGVNGGTITGGTIQLQSVTANPDLIVHQWNTSGPLTLASTISNAANPAVRSGSTTISTSFVTGVTTSDLYVGMPVTGTNIPSGTTVIAVANGSVTLSANATASGTPSNLTFTSANPLSKAGPGTLILSGSNNYTGQTVIGQGTILLNNPAALTTSIVNIGNDGTLGVVSNSIAAGLVGTGNVNTSGTGLSVILAGSGSNTFYGDMEGSGGLIIQGGASNYQQIFWGTATYTGPAVVNSGGEYSIRSTTFATSPSSITVNNGGDVFLLTPMAINQTFNLAGLGLNGVSNDGALHIGGSASVTLNGTINLTADAAIKIDGSSAALVEAGPITSSSNSNLVLLADSGGGTAEISGNITTGSGGCFWSATAPGQCSATTHTAARPPSSELPTATQRSR